MENVFYRGKHPCYNIYLHREFQNSEALSLQSRDITLCSSYRTWMFIFLNPKITRAWLKNVEKHTFLCLPVTVNFLILIFDPFSLASCVFEFSLYVNRIRHSSSFVRYRFCASNCLTQTIVLFFLLPSRSLMISIFSAKGNHSCDLFLFFPQTLALCSYYLLSFSSSLLLLIVGVDHLSWKR